MQRGALVAAAFSDAAAREGLTPDPRLRLLGLHEPGTPVPEALPDGPFDLGPMHERLVGGDERSRRGAWYTPRPLAEDLVARAFAATRRPVATVTDPSCGGGVFLLAAAEHRIRRGASARHAVEGLWGCDTDPVAVAVAEAALWWWSARRGAATVVGSSLAVTDALTGPGIPPADLVVGNPPFLGQLRTNTAAGEERRRALRSRFGDAVRPYTDDAWLFLLAAVEAVAPGGAVALVQPSSLLAARDAGAVRRRVDGQATLVHTWIDDGSTFAAAVETCAPVLCVGSGARNDWSGALATARGVPTVDLACGSTLGDRADVVAGFRDEYYGLVGSIREHGAGPRLITSGSIDPLRHRADSDTRFAKRRWTHPTIDVGSLDGRAARWVRRQAAPKLLVATQTRVVEAVVDPGGDLVGSVPVIVVTPRDPDDLWRLAAALHAPVTTAWMLRRSAGTALSNDACKPTAALLSDVPLPLDLAAWDAAADVARLLGAGDNRWEDFARLADRAYGVDDPTVRSWWLARLPVR